MCPKKPVEIGGISPTYAFLCRIRQQAPIEKSENFYARYEFTRGSLRGKIKASNGKYYIKIWR
jgi:hypothetical protein